MPRLICTLPCETAIISNENKLSLISLLEGMTIGVPPAQNLPVGASVPMRWFAVSVWEKTTADADKEYETYVEIGPIKSMPTKIKLTTPMHRVIAQITGFPIIFGELRLKTFIREMPSGAWTEAGYFPLVVQRGGGLPQ